MQNMHLSDLHPFNTWSTDDIKGILSLVSDITRSTAKFVSCTDVYVYTDRELEIPLDLLDFHTALSGYIQDNFEEEYRRLTYNSPSFDKVNVKKLKLKLEKLLSFIEVTSVGKKFCLSEDLKGIASDIEKRITVNAPTIATKENPLLLTLAEKFHSQLYTLLCYLFNVVFYHVVRTTSICPVFDTIPIFENGTIAVGHKAFGSLFLICYPLNLLLPEDRITKFGFIIYNSPNR